MGLRRVRAVLKLGENNIPVPPPEVRGCLERTLDPNDPDSWEAQADIGAGRHVHMRWISPGLYWFRVKSTRDGHDSTYVGPVSVLVTWAPKKAGSRKPPKNA